MPLPNSALSEGSWVAVLSKPIICSLKVHGHINKSQSKNLTLLQTHHSCFPLVSFKEQRGKWEREESISVTKERKERVGDRQIILAPTATSINPDKPRDGNSWNTTGPRQGSSGPTLRVWKPTNCYYLQPGPGQTLSPGHCTSFLSTTFDFAYWQPNLLEKGSYWGIPFQEDPPDWPESWKCIPG